MHPNTMRESQNIEWKFLWKDDYLKWICGFANAQGGKLYIGVDDDGNVVGLKEYRKLLEDLPNKILRQLGIICDVNLLNEDKSYYIEIIVPAYDVPISYRGQYHYRIGSTKQVLEGTVLNEFLLRKSGKTWDDIPMPGAKISDLSPDAIRAFKAGANKSQRLIGLKDESPRNVLRNLRFMEGDQLKRAALLLFARDPRAFFPNAYVKIGRFGKSDSDLMFQDVVEQNGFQLAEQVVDVLSKKYFTAKIDYENLQRTETPDYPIAALREVLLNAIVHRSYLQAPIQVSVYDDKIVIWNEGRLPNGLSIEQLKQKHPSIPKNPVLADACFKGGLIEAWGRGIIKIMEACEQASLPEPRFEIIGGGIQVTLFKNRYTYEQLKALGVSARQIRAVLWVKEEGQITNSTYKELNKVSERTARRDLRDLVDKFQLLTQKGSKKGTFYILHG